MTTGNKSLNSLVVLALSMSALFTSTIAYQTERGGIIAVAFNFRLPAYECGSTGPRSLPRLVICPGKVEKAGGIL